MKQSASLKSSEQQFFDQLYQRIAPNGMLMSLHELLPYACQQYENRTVLLCQESTLTYGQLGAWADQVAYVLKNKQIEAQDRVILLCENSLAFYAYYFGILQTGAVVVPVNTFLSTSELEHIVHDAQPKLIVSSQALFSKFDGISAAQLLLLNGDKECIYNPEKSVTKQEAIKTDPNAMAVLLYTSGTTGVPKGVMLSSKNCLINAIQGIARLGIASTERVFGVLPLFHSFAQNTCIWSTLLMGCAVIIVPKIDRKEIIKGLAHEPTIFLGVPALFGLLCLLKTVDLSTVKYFVCGGDALPDKIRMGFELIYQRKLCCGYGMTETSPVIAAYLLDGTIRANTVGRPLIGVECIIKDEQDNQLPIYHSGQIWVRGDMVMLGYYNAPEVTAEIMHDGWLATGDLGYYDDEGRLVITGRSKDLIVNKGIKIYPAEVENVIMSHPNVVQVAVIGVDDGAPDQQIPIAYVQVKKADENMVDQLRDLCTINLAAYKIPRQFIVSDQPLALTATGKVDKKILRAQHAKK